MRKLLLAAALLLLSPARGQQVVVEDSSCAGPVTVSCTWSAPRPNGRFVFIHASGLAPGDWLFVFYGFSLDRNATLANLPLPFDMGNLFPSLSWCLLLTSAVGGSYAVAPAGGFATFFYDVPLNIPDVTFQVMHRDPGPAGFMLTHGLRYHP